MEVAEKASATAVRTAMVGGGVVTGPGCPSERLWTEVVVEAVTGHWEGDRLPAAA
jgi:hypothetical protein